MSDPADEIPDALVALVCIVCAGLIILAAVLWGGR